MSAPQFSLTPHQRRERLRLGLVGNRATLYALSPTFKAQIDGLAHLLEPMIDGLAANASDLDRHLLMQGTTLEMLDTLGTLPTDYLQRIMGDDAAPDSEKLDRAARDSEQSGGGKSAP